MRALKSFAQDILEEPLYRKWTIQGLGMLRTYLPGNVRLHVWDPAAEVPDASKLHTHPWDMVSHVIAGSLENVIYGASEDVNGDFLQQQILCGEGGGLCGQPQPVRLDVELRQNVSEGESYAQGYSQIHLSNPQPGTVTVIERTVPGGGDPDYAYVYYRSDEEWGTAEPRPAHPDEVTAITQRALEGF